MAKKVHKNLLNEKDRSFMRKMRCSLQFLSMFRNATINRIFDI